MTVIVNLMVESLDGHVTFFNSSNVVWKKVPIAYYSINFIKLIMIINVIVVILIL